jgi:hypothetical protein
MSTVALRTNSFVAGAPSISVLASAFDEHAV